jgi:hypothetical protein
MKFESIADCFEWLRMDGSASECLIDVMNAHSLGAICLEQHFSNWLWLADGVIEDDVYLTEADKQYARELAKIEEVLTLNGLIYLD